MAPVTQEQHATELAEIAALHVEGDLILARISAAFEAVAGADLQRYVAVRKRLAGFMPADSKFPIPARAWAASKARNELDKKLGQIFIPIVKALR